MEFKIGTTQDLDSVCFLIKDAIAEMEKNGIYQWDEIYPAREDFEEDIMYISPQPPRLKQRQLTSTLNKPSDIRPMPAPVGSLPKPSHWRHANRPPMRSK